METTKKKKINVNDLQNIITKINSIYLKYMERYIKLIIEDEFEDDNSLAVDNTTSDDFSGIKNINGHIYTKDEIDYYFINDKHDYIKEQFIKYVNYKKNKKNGIKIKNPLKEELTFDILQKYCRQLFRIYKENRLAEYVADLFIKEVLEKDLEIYFL